MFTLPSRSFTTTPSFNDNDDIQLRSIAVYSEPQIPTSPTKRLSKLRELYERNRGLLLIGASQLFMVLMNFIVKILSGLSKPVPTFELIAARMIVTCICCIAYTFSAKIPHPILGPPEVRLWLVLRGVFGFFGLFGIYYSLQYLALSDAIAITFLAPSVTAVIGYMFLGELFSAKEAGAGLISLLGVILIARPDSLFGSPSTLHNETLTNTTSALLVRLAQNSTLEGILGPEDDPFASIERGTPVQRLIAVGVALVGVLGASGAYTSLRIIGKRAHTMHSIIYFSAWCVIVSTIGLAAFKVPLVLPSDWKWALGLLCIGLFGFTGQVLLTMGLQRETASRGSLGIYVQILYTTILDRLFFKDSSPSALSIIGICLILFSAIFVALTKPANPNADPEQKQYELLSQNPVNEEEENTTGDDPSPRSARDVEEGKTIAEEGRRPKRVHWS